MTSGRVLLVSLGICCAVWPRASFSEAPIAPYLNLGIGPRAVAMGGAFSAIADDATAAFWNPAGLVSVAGFSVSAEYEAIVADVAANEVAAVVPAGSVALGVWGDLVWLGKYDQRDEYGSYVGSEKLTEVAGAIGLGVRQTWIGGRPGGIGGAVELVNRSQEGAAFGVSLGVTLPVMEETSVGLVMRRFGLASPDGQWPTSINFGISHRLVASVLGAVEGEYAISYREPGFRIGCEWSPVRQASLRGGYAWRPANSRLGGVAGIGLGAGLRWKRYEVNYAFQPFGELATIHRFAVAYVATAGAGYGGSSGNVDAVGRSEAPGNSAAPPNADALYQESAALYAAGEYAGAWGKAAEAIRIDSRHWQSWQMVGNCQFAMGDKPGAMTSYRTSLQLHPDNPGLKAWLDQQLR